MRSDSVDSKPSVEACNVRKVVLFDKCFITMSILWLFKYPNGLGCHPVRDSWGRSYHQLVFRRIPNEKLNKAKNHKGRKRFIYNIYHMYRNECVKYYFQECAFKTKKNEYNIYFFLIINYIYNIDCFVLYSLLLRVSINSYSYCWHSPPLGRKCQSLP